ncbi:MAG: hypothetical protein KBS65_03640 [Prevotella sp.]|nr:hypothetical protein [Candidatus Equicola stercoris]
MKRPHIFIFLFFCVCYSVTFAQRTVVSTGTYTYILKDNETPKAGEQKVLELAMQDAVKKAFGRRVGVKNLLNIGNKNGESSSDFSSYGWNLVNGTWVETIGKPQINRTFDDEGHIVFSCTITGKVKEGIDDTIDLEVKALKDPNNLLSESSEFFGSTAGDNRGDRLYLYFKSPVAGYLNVYLVDEDNGIAYCLLPERDATSGTYKVRRNHEYCFFKGKETNSDRSGRVYFTCEKPIEHNTIHVVFSPREFLTSTFDSHKEDYLADTLPLSDYEAWFARLSARDSQVKRVAIGIKLRQIK